MSAFPAGLMAGALPADVVVVDALDSCFEGSRLVRAAWPTRDVAFPTELDALGAAPPARRREFARARVCAHAAVAGLGHPPEPILMGPRREPQWPPGVVGSITHGSGYRAAAVADALSVLAIGVDAERDQPLPAELGGLALTDADRAASARLPRFRSWDRVAFSARESVFKAWFGVTGRWLGFPDVTLSLQPDGRHGGHFTATVGADVAGVRELVQACGTTVLTGCFQWAPGLVLTAVTLRHAAGGRPPVAPSSRPSPWVKPS